MEKRGQFFVFGAIILCLAIFVLVTKVNTYEEKILLEDFPDLTDNYKTESVKVVNDALLNNLDPNANLDDFTNQFVDYSRTINPQIGFVYVYRDKDGNAVISNHFYDKSLSIYKTEDITITPKTPTDALFSDNTKVVNDVSLNVGGLQFEKTIPVKINKFDNSYYSAGGYTGPFYIEVGGIFYPIDIKTNTFTAISRTESGGQIGVDIS